MDRKAAKLRIERIEKEFSDDFHNIFTPFELCDEMLNKIPELNKDQQIMVMFNLEFLFVLQERFGKENMNNVWFLTPCEIKKEFAIAIGVNENQVLTYSYKDKKIIIGKEKMPKFDVVVGNPPFKSGMHLSFLQMAYNMSKKYVIWISPSAWILDEKGKDRKAIKIRNLIKDDLDSITLFNGNYIFDVGLFLPFSIITLIKEKIKSKIKVTNKVIGNIEEYETIEEINKWNDLKIYPKLKEKILFHEDNLLKHKNKINGEYFINFSLIRGNTSRENDNKMVQDDFYSFFPKDIKIEKNSILRTEAKTGSKGSYANAERGKGISFFFTFKTEDEAQNFLNFLKTQFAMFALSIYKINSNLDRGELKSVPWLDFTQKWNDEKLYKHFDLSEKEIKFIETNIPKYY